MNARINEQVVKYIKENEEEYKGITIKENDLWHLNKIIQNKLTEKEKNIFELEKDGIIIKIPMTLFNLKSDIIPE